jgi:thioredoxin reductase (NADPH)
MDASLLWYLVPMVAVIGAYLVLHKRSERRTAAKKAASIAAGLHEPVSLHPKIDPHKCIGCGACVSACPEGDILGLIHGKAELIAASGCIGHGACRTSCPAGAIELVFGTEKRGVELPNVGPDFQTNVPGLFIAGELGGMGLIKNAVEQGRQAIENIAKMARSPSGNYDVVIVGAGAAGISASLAAKERKLRYLTLEQDSLGGTIAHFPRGKVVMTSPARLPLVGKVKFREIGKEALLKFWSNVAREHQLQIAFGERVDSIERQQNELLIKTQSRSLRAGAVLLAVGRRGTPRRLSVPGEHLSKVVYTLIEPEQYQNKHVLVVGGGDSALETAATLAEETNAAVNLCYRSEAFARAKPKNRERIQAALRTNRLSVRMATDVKEIAPHAVTLTCRGSEFELRNDAVIVCVGGTLPTEFLKNVGIHVETKWGTA